MLYILIQLIVDELYVVAKHSNYHYHLQLGPWPLIKEYLRWKRLLRSYQLVMEGGLKKVASGSQKTVFQKQR